MGKAIDLTNQQFGRLTVIERDKKRKKVYWICKCNCGNIISVRSDHLRSNKIVSCGCLQKEKAKEVGNKTAKDYSGIISGWLTIIEPLNYSTEKTQNRVWKAKCKCGREIAISTDKIGRQKSCGCRPQIDYTNHKINNFTVKEFIGSDKEKGPLWNCLCDCGKEFICPSKYLPYRKSCGCISSYKEEEINKFLKDKNFTFCRQYSFSNLEDTKGWPLRFDFAIFKNDNLYCLIEYQGRQHYDKSSKYYSEDLIKHDNMKKEYCKENNIKLYELNKNTNIENFIYELWEDIFEE